MAPGRDGDYSQLGFEETELRLGLPCGDDGEAVKATGKREFSETINLKLKLRQTTAVDVVDGARLVKKLTREPSPKDLLACEGTDPEEPPIPKARVVGWPPVTSFRKNILSAKPINKDDGEKSGGASASFVKVSMDGVPYLRKVDLKMFRSYQELFMALEKMFGFFISGNCGSQLWDFMNENKLVDLLNGSEYVPIYEDKDKDWMLVGDVPWEMFNVSCKRLRIMKGSEAIGLAPNDMEKCKNRS